MICTHCDLAEVTPGQPCSWCSRVAPEQPSADVVLIGERDWHVNPVQACAYAPPLPGGLLMEMYENLDAAGKGTPVYLEHRGFDTMTMRYLGSLREWHLEQPPFDPQDPRRKPPMRLTIEYDPEEPSQ